MNGKEYFEKYNFEYHDGSVFDICFEGADMLLSVVRCPMRLRSKEDENSLFQRLKFNNATEFWLWDHNKTLSGKITWDEMWKSATADDICRECSDGRACWIDDAFFENGMVVYDCMMRFKCDGIEILESRTNPEYFG